MNPIPQAYESSQMMFGAGETVISGYFAGQMAGMMLTGHRARRMSAQQNEQNISFQQELNDIRQKHALERSKAELDFLRECHKKGMAFQRESARISCENRKQEEEFRKFCETIWLTHFRPEIGAILEAMTHPVVDIDNVTEMKLLIARTPLTAKGMDRKGSYADFCEEFKEEYLKAYNLHIDGMWLRAWERDCVSAMADTMNLHYIMQGMPTIILYPIQRGDNLSLETATWGYQLGQTGMAFEKTFRVPFKEIEEKQERLELLMIASAAYIDDCYRVFLCQSKPDSIYRLKRILKEDEMVWSLLCGKYTSLLQTSDRMQETLLLDTDEKEKLASTVQI